MNPWLLTTIIVALVVVIVIKRLIGEPVTLRDLFAAPVILTGIGIWSLTKVEELTGTDLAWVTAGTLLGGALGALRGATIQLTGKKGALWQRYTGRTFLAVIASLVVMAGFGVLAAKMGMHEGARPLQLSLGISFLGESLVVGRRGMTSGIPFAPERSS
ncbi:DUF1453 domain-containing protein [Streptomyces sp. RS10V-4]|uniref:DUF1453 domain-containing protein n=1 Tax=Streptomyces rhizoryzae TaxID=2932493 RepID=UPI002004E848|nr:DUF1453 domain-containing protein [Streptomyces rhizoryzae]MCK7621829.1 DUF1453 domain-containing protein [Streptomyces rhizoryzae]